MGVMSRKVLPLCGNLCVCCPGLRARSRQPVKRYKKLLADIFPKSQDEPPNDRKICKLTEYASKNTFRIPEIASHLETRGYKELRYERYGSVKTIMRTFCTLFASCKDEMPLFAIRALNMIIVLLDQQNDEMRILGCLTTVEFINHQVDTTYLHNLEALIPKFCTLARDSGPEQRRLPLRAAGLQALSAMLCFMGEFSHICKEFDQIVTAVLDNYEVVPVEAESEKEPFQNFVKGILKGTVSITRLSFNMDNFRMKFPKSLTKEESEMPKVWSQICVQNIAALGKEATTVRRVLDSVFNYFDRQRAWLPETGVSFSVLRDMLLLLEKTGNDHIILGALVRHLDHKNVANELQLKTSIVKITTVLARHSKPRSPLVEVVVLHDLSRHLRRSLQSSFELSNSDTDRLELHRSFQSAIRRCLLELVKRVGEAGPIMDQMALILEKLSSTPVVARTTIEALAVLAHILIALSIVDFNQAFPEALFYQLLRAMIYPDLETRLGSHHIFSVLMVPSTSDDPPLIKTDMEVLFRTPPGAAAALCERLTRRRNSDNGEEFKDAVEFPSPENKELEMGTVRLSGHQAWLLLTNLRVQSVVADSSPMNFEAIGHTYTLALLFSRPKTSSNSTCIRAFQLAFGLRSLALDPNALESASRRRSLFTLATAMIIVAAIVYDVREIIPLAKSLITNETKDPFLCITEDNGLKLCHQTETVTEYGSPGDEEASKRAMSLISIPPEASNEALASMIVNMAPLHLEMGGPGVAELLLQPFSTEDALSLGPNIRLEAFEPQMSLPMESLSFDEVLPSIDDDTLSQSSGVGLPRLLADAPVPPPSTTAMGVSQLLESALEAAGQVASITTPSSPVSYTSLATHCEEFVARTRRNMSIVMKLDGNAAPATVEAPQSTWTQAIGPRSKSLNESPIFSPPWLTPSPRETWPLVKLPPASPYDNFLKAAGC